MFPAIHQAQDLIVTHKGDSLNCKITKIKGGNVYFTFKHKEEVRNTLLPQSQVNYYQYGYYPVPEVSAREVYHNAIYPHYRIAVDGGWSYRTVPLAEGAPSALKSGFHYGLDLSYFFTEYLGAGFRYNDFLSKAEIISPGSGKSKDNISIRFIGPYFSTRFLNSSKTNALFLNLGIGYTGYKDQAQVIAGGDKITLTGNTAGISYDIGYDIGVSKDLAIGFQLSLYTGILSQFKSTKGNHTETIVLEKGQYEGLSRIAVSVGLRFNK
jgi:hypothetical protein